MKRYQPFTLPLLWIVMIVMIALMVSVLGIEITGDAQAWRQWLDAHAGHFQLWRIALYTLLAYGTFRLHQQLRRNSTGIHQHRALLRAEIAAVLTLTLLEIQNWRMLSL